MAHIEKYQASAIGRMCGHYAREAEAHGYVRENIDGTRTRLNYNLGPVRAASPAEFVDQRIGELHLKRRPRKDAVRMIDIVVTMPRGWMGGDRAFFEAVKATLDGIFGAENCISAWVHMDESQPHLHYACVPVTEDGRLSAKSLLSRAFLKSFHARLERGVCDRLGVERVGLVLSDSERGDRAAKYVGLPEYKAATSAAREARERAERAAAEADEAEGRAKALRGEIGALERRKADIGFAAAQAQMRKEDEDRALKELRAQVAGAKAELARCESDAADAERAAKEAHADLEALTARRDAVAADLATVSAGLADARAERDRVTKDRDAARRERDKAIAARDAAKNSQAKAEGRAKEAEERLARIQSQVAQAKEDLARLRAEIAEVIGRAKAIFREWWVSLEREPPIEDMAREAASAMAEALRDYGYVDDTSHEER